MNGRVSRVLGVFGAVACLATLGVTAGPALSGAATAHADDDFRYEQGRITKSQLTSEGMMITLDRGSQQQIYEGSTGVVYAGAGTQFLTDDGVTIRFRVKTVSERESQAIVFQGDVDSQDLVSNPRVVLRARKAGRTVRCPTLATVDGQKIDGCVVDKIRKWDAVIAKVSAAKGVDANLIRGVIAAESGGNEKEVSASGYKGLMQSSRNATDLDGETSINSGADNLKDKEKALRIRLKRLSLDLDMMAPESKLDAILAAYNAGQATVQMAAKYAKDAGDINRWTEVKHFGRAAMFTGAYSSKAAFKWCVGDKPAAEKKQLIDAAEKARRGAFLGKGSTFEEALAAGAPPLMVCAAKFKATFSPAYRVEINAYRHYFERAK